MKLTPRKITYASTSQQCQNCGQVYKGKVCNMCGEKVFHQHQLSAKHFLHEIIDFFYHFENKVIHTLNLNFLKPGFVTKQNLNGIRVPYAKPVQLYLVVAIIFYLIVTKVGLTDYVPQYGDHNYYFLSEHKGLGWTKPLDDKVVNGIDSMWVRKGRTIENDILQDLRASADSNGGVYLKARMRADSLYVPADKLSSVSFKLMQTARWQSFQSKVGTLAKTLIFVLLPFFAAFFFFVFYRKIQYYGASLILATHFMVYNLCFYTLYAVINIWPLKFNENLGGWMFKPFTALLYDTKLEVVSNMIWASEFEMIHHVMWMPWMFIAFKRLFATSWWKNLLISYISCKLFFFLIFGVLKKALIAFTIWSM